MISYVQFVRSFSIFFHSRENEYFLRAKNVAFAREPDVGKGTRAARIRSRFFLYKGENLFGLFFILSLFSLVFLPRNFFPFRHSADCSERKTRDKFFDHEEHVETMETSCIKFARMIIKWVTLHLNKCKSTILEFSLIRLVSLDESNRKIELL